MFSKIALKHRIDIEHFTSDYSVFGSKASSELVQEISPLVEDFKMLSCNLDSGFFPIPASKLFLRMNPLESGEFLFSREIELGICNSNSFLVSEKAFNPDINSNLGFRIAMLDDRNILLTGEDSKPLPSLVLLDGESLDLPLGTLCRMIGIFPILEANNLLSESSLNPDCGK